MNIYAVTPHYLSSIQELFSDVAEVKLLPTNYLKQNLDIDLLIFSGGEDINPKTYGENSVFMGYDDSRDTYELKVFESILEKQIRPVKVLGFCRGLQLINVALGGSLIQDIQTELGKNHETFHEVVSLVESKFDFFSTVNSLHHQAIKDCGNRLKHRVLLKHPKDSVAEMVLWGNFILGTQFHPEFFPRDLPEKSKFVGVINDWVNTDSALVLKKESSSNTKNKVDMSMVEYLGALSAFSALSTFSTDYTTTSTGINSFAVDIDTD
jgi:putative glutamine amidotransferase